jgi:hypothetical protein
LTNYYNENDPKAAAWLRELIKNGHIANGIPARMGRLRGYGNAIVPQVAAEFVRATMDSGHGC